MAHLFAKVYQHTNFQGEYRWIQHNISSFGGTLGFNDKVSSIIVYRGNEYQDGDIIRFYQHTGYDGGYLDIGPGVYPNIHVQPFSFGDKISSCVITPTGNQGAQLVVRLVVRLYEHVSYGGQHRELLLSERSLSNLGFNDKVSSIAVDQGEDYSANWVCDFYQHADFGGGMLQPGHFGPGTRIANIKNAPYQFNDVISSVRIYTL